MQILLLLTEITARIFVSNDPVSPDRRGRVLYRGGSAASRLLGLGVQIQPWAWMSVFFECCVLSGSGLCDGPITRPKESYRMWCVYLFLTTKT